MFLLLVLHSNSLAYQASLLFVHLLCVVPNQISIIVLLWMAAVVRLMISHAKHEEQGQGDTKEQAASREIWLVVNAGAASTVC